MLVQPEVDLHKWTPLGALGLADQMHPRLLRCVIGFAGVARYARAHDVFPGRGTAAVARDDVIQIQVFAVESLAAILADVVIPLENVVPRELDFFLRQPVKHHQQDDARHADFERNSPDAFRVRLLDRKIMPLIKAESLKRTVVGVQNHLSMAFEKKRQRASRCADVDRLPQTIEDQHMLV